MDFETVLKLLVVVGAAVAIPVAAYAAIAGTRTVWINGEPGRLGADDVEALHHRVKERGSPLARLGDLEDRLHFTERSLAQSKSAGPLREEN